MACEAIQRTERVQFRLINHTFDINLMEWCNLNYFGFVSDDTHVRWSNGLLSPSTIKYFHTMDVYDSIPTGGDIECHAVRYLYYVITNTLQACGEFPRVNEEDMMVLAKAANPGCNMTLNLGAMLLFYLYHQVVQTRRPIVCGGVATVLANTLQIPIGNLQPLASERCLGFLTLRSCHMITKSNGRFVVHIPGAGRTYPAPLPHYLFSIEDRPLHYDA
jgi:hypothetical protein